MKSLKNIHIAHIAGVILCILAVFAAVFFYLQTENLVAEKNTLTQQSQQRELALATKVQELEKQYVDTLDQLALSQEEREELAEDLEKEKEKVDEIEDEYDRINDTVKDLVKLGSTDEELLQKYSKVYFLNENYIPSRLKTISNTYLYGNKPLEIHASVWPYLEKMLEDASDDDIDLKILSAYRSFQYQQQIKQTYVTIYGSGANKFSADQGYSEHQLGTTVDFTNDTIGSSLSLFEATEQFKWLRKNAHKYGFTLSYPSGNNFYQYEPWHWRFVGKDLADDLDDDNKYFYDLNQRDIDEYLIDIFD